ncbi:MAG TPA: type II toxin-antitoxin system HicB family antitoxin [Acidobacteriota bacterium]|jgi:antitoxin HicB
MKDLKYYMSLPYTVILRLDDEGDYIARVDELQGCSAHGKTAQEALDNLQEVKELWVTDALENGESIPEPSSESPLPSGKWVQRVPRSLHGRLVAAAKREGVSLNQLVTSILAEAVGVRERPQAVPEQCDVFYIADDFKAFQRGSFFSNVYARCISDPWMPGSFRSSLRLHSSASRGRSTATPLETTFETLKILEKQIPYKREVKIKEDIHGKKEPHTHK